MMNPGISRPAVSIPHSFSSTSFFSFSVLYASLLAHDLTLNMYFTSTLRSTRSFLKMNRFFSIMISETGTLGGFTSTLSRFFWQKMMKSLNFWIRTIRGSCLAVLVRRGEGSNAVAAAQVHEAAQANMDPTGTAMEIAATTLVAVCRLH